MDSLGRLPKQASLQCFVENAASILTSRGWYSALNHDQLMRGSPQGLEFDSWNHSDDLQECWNSHRRIPELVAFFLSICPYWRHRCPISERFHSRGIAALEKCIFCILVKFGRNLCASSCSLGSLIQVSLCLKNSWCHLGTFMCTCIIQWVCGHREKFNLN